MDKTKKTVEPSLKNKKKFKKNWRSGKKNFYFGQYVKIEIFEIGFAALLRSSIGFSIFSFCTTYF